MNISESVYGSSEWAADIVADAAVDIYKESNSDAQMECNVVLEGDTALLFGNATQSLPKGFCDAIESAIEGSANCKLRSHIVEVSALAPKLYIASGYSVNCANNMPLVTNLTDQAAEVLRESGFFPEARCRLIDALSHFQIDVRHPGMTLDEARERVFELVVPCDAVVGPEINLRGAWTEDWRTVAAPLVTFSHQRSFLAGHTNPAIGRSWNHPERVASSLARVICVSMSSVGHRESKSLVGINAERRIEFIELFTREAGEWDQYILTIPDLDLDEVASMLACDAYSYAAEFGYYGNEQLPWEHPWEDFHRFCKKAT